jgi:CDP-diacylglycerol--glycerol-3-phosphate 3-phosphatidyltransferase
MIMIILLIVDFGGVFDVLEQIFIWLSLALTIVSLVTYIWQNKGVLSMQD